MSRRVDWRRSRAVETPKPAPAGVRIWREAVDKRTGEVREAPSVELGRLSLLMNEIYRRRLPARWAERLLRRRRVEEE